MKQLFEEVNKTFADLPKEWLRQDQHGYLIFDGAIFFFQFDKRVVTLALATNDFCERHNLPKPTLTPASQNDAMPNKEKETDHEQGHGEG